MKQHKYFTYKEVIYSYKAEKNGIDNEPKDEKIIDNLDYSMDRLDEIRESYNHPIIISSGYRCEQLNKLVGGEKYSYHLKGLAFDLVYSENLFHYLRTYAKFDKLILEKSKGTTWIHIQFKRNREEEKNQVIFYVQEK